MRFSGIFQRPPTSQRPAPEKAARAMPGVAPEPREPVLRELPEELDARVRLVGEWQLGEG